MNDTIDLGETNEAMPSPGPDIDKQEPYYPDVTLSHPSLLHLPNTGKSVIEHEVVSRTHEKDHKGRPQHRVRIKIKSIRPMGRKKPFSNPKMSAENAMRDMME